MRLNRSMLLSAAFLAILGGCKSSDDPAPVKTPPAPAPTGNTTTTVTTGTQTTTTVGGTTVTVPAPTATALTALASGSPVKVEVSQNDPAKQPASGMTALGSLPSGASSTAVWTFTATKATTITDPAEPATGAAAAAQTITITFSTSGAGRQYKGVFQNGQTWQGATVTVGSGTVTFTINAETLPVTFVGQEYWTSTSIN